MTATEIAQFIQGGEWVSITPEVRPGIAKSAAGNIQPFYCTRVFRYSARDRFECVVVNYADSNAKVPLVKFVIRGHLRWQGPHPIAEDAQKLDYVADEAYEVTPLHEGFADAVNAIPGGAAKTEGGLAEDIQKDVLKKWAVGSTQDLKGKAFPAFGLSKAEIYVDYDLIYCYEGMLFNGSKNVDGRPFDKPENRPTNLQIPLIRKKSV